MRISLLEKREDFYRIFVETLDHSLFFKRNSEIKTQTFVINKYLNFVASLKMSSSVFENLVNEYSSSLTWFIRPFQWIYVKLAVSKSFRKFFGHKLIKLSNEYENFLILGGNHRLRLFSEELNYSIVILKKNERFNYIENDIDVRTKNNINYAPVIYEYGDDWFKEEYFSGTPLNRLKNRNEIENFKTQIIKKHMKELILPTKNYWDIIKYADFINNEIDSILFNPNISEVCTENYMIKTLLSNLFDRLTINKVVVSCTHGDFQMANILIKDSQFKIIDWESASKRFFLYDVFVLLGGIRSGVPLKESIQILIKKISFIENVKINSDIILLLLIEELRFSINESYSENFYISGSKTKQICESILEFLSE